MDPREFAAMNSPVTMLADKLKEKDYKTVADTLERYGGAYASRYFVEAIMRSGVPIEEAYKGLWTVLATTD